MLRQWLYGTYICTEKAKFENIEKINKTLNLGNSESTKISGAGNVRVVVNNGENEIDVNFEKVYYVPDLRTNLLSVAQITDRGYEMLFRESCALVTDREGKIIFRADRVGNLYYLKQRDGKTHEVNTVMPKSEIDE